MGAVVLAVLWRMRLWMFENVLQSICNALFMRDAMRLILLAFAEEKSVEILCILHHKSGRHHQEVCLLCPWISVKAKRCRRDYSCPSANLSAHLYHLEGMYNRVIQRHLYCASWSSVTPYYPWDVAAGGPPPPLPRVWFGWHLRLSSLTHSSEGLFPLKAQTYFDSVFLSLPPLFFFQACISSYTDCHRLHFTNSGCLKVKFTAHPPEPQQPTLIFQITIMIIIAIRIISRIIIKMCKKILFGEQLQLFHVRKSPSPPF